MQEEDSSRGKATVVKQKCREEPIQESVFWVNEMVGGLMRADTEAGCKDKKGKAYSHRYR